MCRKGPKVDGRNSEQRKKQFNRGWEDLGSDKPHPPTFQNKSSFKQGDEYGEWRFSTQFGWIHADDWLEVHEGGHPITETTVKKNKK